MRKFRWGVIGAGRIARTFAEALRGCETAVPYAVASRSAEKAAAFAKENGFEKSFGSYAELAADDAVDVVYIATPMASHFGDARLCIENGRNVLCEKSVTLNSRQLRSLLELADEKGVFFMEAMWMKCRPTYLKALEYVREGRIGQPRFVKADFCCSVPYSADDRLFRPDCGGGALLDLGVYPITLAADFLGREPAEIISSANILRGVDMSDAILLRYDGAFASINAGFEAEGRNRALISGDEGYIVFGDWFHCSSEFSLFDRDGNLVERFEEPPLVNGYEYEIIEAQKSLAEGLRESVLVPRASTEAVARIMDECRKTWGLVFPGENDNI